MQRKFNIRDVSTLVLVLMLVSSTFAILAVTPSASAQTTPTITLSTTTVKVRDTVTITCTGLKPDTEYSLKLGDYSLPETAPVNDHTLDRPSIAATTGDVKTDARGVFWIRWTVGDIDWSLPAEKRQITVHEGPDTTAAVVKSVPITITPSIRVRDNGNVLTITSATVGTNIRVELTGFKDELVTIKFADVTLGTADPDSYGYFLVSAGAHAVPAKGKGSYTISAEGVTSGNVATTTFSVTPAIALTSDGSTSTVSMSQDTASIVYIAGTGFTAETIIPANSITIGPVTAVHGAITVGATGSFSSTAVIANVITLQGVYDMRVAGENFSNAIIVSKTGIIPMLQLSVTSGFSGAGITVFASGLPAASDWIISFDVDGDGVFGETGENFLTGQTSDARGALRATGTLPHAAMGVRGIDVKSTTATVDFGDFPVPASYSVVPRITTALITGFPGQSGVSVAITGFVADEAVTATIGGKAAPLVSGSVGADGRLSTTMTIPDPIPGPSQPLNISGTTAGNFATATVTIRAMVTTVETTGVIGSLITITGKGLRPLESYRIVWDGVGGGGSAVLTFTTNADGNVPALTRFAIPSGSVSGPHIVDLARTATPTTSEVWGTVVSGSLYTAAGFRTIRVDGVARVSPTAGFVEDILTVSGEGLMAGRTYVVELGGAPMVVFTSTMTGTIPPRTNFTFPSSTSGSKAGVSQTINIRLETTAGSIHATAFFVLLPKVSISPTRGEAGALTTVTLTGTGLGASTSYYVILLERLPLSPDNPGTILTQFTSESDGDVPPGVVFVMPLELPAGVYYIDLAATTHPTTSILPTLPRFTLTAVAPPVLPGTGTFTPSAPTLLDSAGRAVTSVPRNTAFYTQINATSNVGVDLSVLVIAQVRDATGRVVSMGITTADIRAGTTKAVPVAFLGIATPGTYTVSIFVWSSITDPIALAPTTTFSITIT